MVHAGAVQLGPLRPAQGARPDVTTGSGNQFGGKRRRGACSKVKVFALNAQTKPNWPTKCFTSCQYSLYTLKQGSKIVQILKILYDSGTTLAGVEASDEMEAKTYESND